MPRKEVIAPANLSPAGPPLSPGIKVGNMVYVSGQVGRHPATGQMGNDVREQTRNSLERIKAILEAAGTSLDNVVSATCWLVNQSDFAAFNEEYAKYFPANRPARATVQAGLMGANALVEIMVTASIPD
ncbi:MAG TPA: RidA family protein [Candidatus Tectomicrobia bacterium]|nr:RidA family protein [Candidatus Tectomicrobia bacterium]